MNLNNGELGGMRASYNLDAKLFTPLSPMPLNGVYKSLVSLWKSGGMRDGIVSSEQSLALSK